MFNISRLLETPWTKTLASWKAEAGNIHPPSSLAASQSPIEDRTGQNRAGPGGRKKRRLLWPRLLKRRSPEEWCWQCGKMCFSLKHGYTHIHTNTHFICTFKMGVHILAADKVEHSHTVLWTLHLPSLPANFTKQLFHGWFWFMSY